MKKVERHLHDDAQLTKCTIVCDLVVDSHTEYVLLVEAETGGCQHLQWTIQRRFREFESLDKQLRISRLNLPLPPKKFFGNMKKSFISQRKMALQEYLNTIINDPYLSFCQPIRQFFDPYFDCSLQQDKATKMVSQLLAEDSRYQIIRKLDGIGWRADKQYFLVKNLRNSEERILSWIWFSEAQRNPSPRLRDLIINLQYMQNPSFVPIEYVKCCDSGALFIRKVIRKGSLRDLLCRSDPLDPYIKKYCNPVNRMLLQGKLIRKFGRDLLIALEFLQQKQFPYGHLHTSNIVYEDGSLQLLDVENALMGLTPQHRRRWLRHGTVDCLERVDSYTFLDCLHEAVFGHPAHFPASRGHLSVHPPVDIVNLLAPVWRGDPPAGREAEEWDRQLVPVSQLRKRSEFHLWNKLPSGRNLIRKRWRMTYQMKLLLIQIGTKVELQLMEDQRKLRF